MKNIVIPTAKVKKVAWVVFFVALLVLFNVSVFLSGEFVASGIMPGMRALMIGFLFMFVLMLSAVSCSFETVEDLGSGLTILVVLLLMIFIEAFLLALQRLQHLPEPVNLVYLSILLFASLSSCAAFPCYYAIRKIRKKS